MALKSLVAPPDPDRDRDSAVLLASPPAPPPIIRPIAPLHSQYAYDPNAEAAAFEAAADAAAAAPRLLALDPSDPACCKDQALMVSLLNNLSFCLFYSAHYSAALSAALAAVGIDPVLSEKGWYCAARALIGLRSYSVAKWCATESIRVCCDATTMAENLHLLAHLHSRRERMELNRDVPPTRRRGRPVAVRRAIHACAMLDLAPPTSGPPPPIQTDEHRAYVKALKYQGNERAARSDHVRAADAYGKAARSFAPYAPALVQRARSFLYPSDRRARPRVLDAVLSSLAALALDPALPDAYVTHCEALMAVAEPQRALDVCDRGILRAKTAGRRDAMEQLLRMRAIIQPAADAAASQHAAAPKQPLQQSQQAAQAQQPAAAPSTQSSKSASSSSSLPRSIPPRPPIQPMLFPSGLPSAQLLQDEPTVTAPLKH